MRSARTPSPCTCSHDKPCSCISRCWLPVACSPCTCPTAISTSSGSPPISPKPPTWADGCSSTTRRVRRTAVPDRRGRSSPGPPRRSANWPSTRAGRRRRWRSIRAWACGRTTSTTRSRSCGGDEPKATSPQDLAGGVPTWRAHHPASRVSGSPTEVEALDRRAVARAAWQRAKGEKLVRNHRTLEDVATRQVEGALQIHRRDHLAGHDRAAKIRRVVVQHIKAPVGKGLAETIPRGVAQGVGRVLHEDRHEMAARRSHRGIHHRGNRALQNRALRGPTVLGVIVGALDVVEIRAYVDRPPVLGSGPGTGPEVRQLGEGHV